MRPCPMGRELWINLGDYRQSIGQKLKVSTLQSYNPTFYSIKAYTFVANTTFNRSFLPPICVVIWIYFLYYSPWCIRIWRKKLLLWFPGSWRQPLRVDGPKASQRSIITYEIHFCIDQAKTHREVRFDLIFYSAWANVENQILLLLVCFLPKSVALRPCLQNGAT